MATVGTGLGPETQEAAEEARAALAQVTAALPAGGEQRHGQGAMAAAVAQALVTGRHLVVQAGTGTGKSLAYLVPSALSGQRVVVATATKALQDQLAERDLPLVNHALKGGVTWAILKGRSNYLCRQRAVELGERGFQSELFEERETDTGSERAHRGGPSSQDPDPEHGGLIDQVQWLLSWAERSDTGDRAELPFEPSPRAWSMVSVGPRECPGAYRCPSGSRCFAEAAREAAASASVVVVNTHLYGAHLASERAVLPPHELVVFDEAHQLEEVMTASLGVELSPGRLRSLAALARPLIEDPGRQGTPQAEPGRRQGSPGELVAMADRLTTALAERLGRRVDGHQELAEILEVADRRIRKVMEQLRSAAPHAPEEEGRRQRALSAASHLADDLGRLGEARPGDVLWVDGTRRAPVLRASPIDVGSALGPLWEEVTAVMTSATIPPRLGERLGIGAGKRDQMDVGSPFDYPNQALLYVARHLPDRRHPDSEAAVHQELASLIEAAGGRTLALFTSHRALEAATDALRQRLEVPLLAQGDLPKGRLLQAFAEDETSCLFATMGFWQGIDVPGPSLSLVTLDRLPFARPDDPLVQARREAAGPAAFSTVDLPRAATLLAQGAGRLIRAAGDVGVVAVLDPRLATASYRRVLLAGVPPMRRTTDPAQVASFLQRALGR